LDCDSINSGGLLNLPTQHVASELSHHTMMFRNMMSC